MDLLLWHDLRRAMMSLRSGVQSAVRFPSGSSAGRLMASGRCSSDTAAWSCKPVRVRALFYFQKIGKSHRRWPGCWAPWRASWRLPRPGFLSRPKKVNLFPALPSSWHGRPGPVRVLGGRPPTGRAGDLPWSWRPFIDGSPCGATSDDRRRPSGTIPYHEGSSAIFFEQPCACSKPARTPRMPALPGAARSCA
jgi:hypothetical protein